MVIVWFGGGGSWLVDSVCFVFEGVASSPFSCAAGDPSTAVVGVSSVIHVARVVVLGSDGIAVLGGTV